MAESLTVVVMGPFWPSWPQPPGSGADGGHAALGALDAVEAAVGGGDSNRAAAVAALRQRRKSRHLSCRRAAAGAAGSAGEVPRVAAGRAEAIFGGTLVAHLRRVRLAQNNRPRRPDPLRDDVVGVGNVVLEDEGAVGGADALGGVQVLDGDGNAVKGGQVVAPHDRRLGVLRPADSHVADDGEVGVELRVEAVDATQVELDKLHGGDIPRSRSCRAASRRG